MSEGSCPQCGYTKLYKDGLRNLANGEQVQRWLCRKCGYRFSERNVPPQRISKQSLKRTDSLGKGSQICAILEEAKNLTTATETKTVAGEKSRRLVTKDKNGLIVQFMAYMEREGYTEQNRYPYLVERLTKLGADLLDPESVKEAIAKQKIKDGTKIQYVYAYAAFAKMLKITWQIPHYTQEENLPFIPDENELDQLIASCRSKRMAAFLQCLKETFADPGEALRIRWIDITGNIITINFPVKGHLPRQLQVSNKLLAMLNSMPKTSERIFPTTYPVMQNCYLAIKKRAAEIQKNPRLLSIEFRTFRHWGGTMLAHYTNGNVLTVKKLLGHKRIENTMKYIGMIHFKDDQYEVTTATTIEEAKQVLSAGFDFVTEKNGIMLFRKPKRFSKVLL
ncbi:MAG TPA: tyrosine-type recombinase/integrase [Candidatus Bathyarchaeia archaeon]